MLGRAVIQTKSKLSGNEQKEKEPELVDTPRDSSVRRRLWADLWKRGRKTQEQG